MCGRETSTSTVCIFHECAVPETNQAHAQTYMYACKQTHKHKHTHPPTNLTTPRGGIWYGCGVGVCVSMLVLCMNMYAAPRGSVPACREGGNVGHTVLPPQTDGGDA